MLPCKTFYIVLAIIYWPSLCFWVLASFWVKIVAHDNSDTTAETATQINISYGNVKMKSHNHTDFPLVYKESVASYSGKQVLKVASYSYSFASISLCVAS